MIGMFRRVSGDEATGLVDGTLEIGDFDTESLTVDKAWHGIHYTLTGDAWEGTLPLGFILAGTPCGDEDLGYGPARALTPAEVSRVAEALLPLDRAAFEARVDPAASRAAAFTGMAGRRNPWRTSRNTSVTITIRCELWCSTPRGPATDC